MSGPKFSVVTPTWNRNDGRLVRCIESVYTQTYRSFEHVVVDDGSEDGTRELCEKLQGTLGALNYDLKYVRIEHQGRVVARNEGMAEAEGQWVVWLDSDDTLDPEYLKTLAYHATRQPRVHLWVCGSRYHGMVKDESGKHVCPKWTELRRAWKPPLYEGDEHDWVHDHFPSGRVGTGMFVFDRAALETVGLMPPWKNHLEIADGVDEWLGYQTGYSAEERWAGNPYGDDWAFFRALTMHFEVHVIKACLYSQYVR